MSDVTTFLAFSLPFPKGSNFQTASHSYAHVTTGTMLLQQTFSFCFKILGNRNSSVDIVTYYVLNGPGSITGRA